MGEGVFICRRGQRRPLRAVSDAEAALYGRYCMPDEVPCPLGKRPPGCDWAGPVEAVVEHLAGVHGRQYDRG